MFVIRYIPRIGAVLAISGLVLLMVFCLVGLLMPNSLNAGIFQSSVGVLPAQSVFANSNTQAKTALPPEAQAAATAAALLDVLPFADALSTAIATLRPNEAVAGGVQPNG